MENSNRKSFDTAIRLLENSKFFITPAVEIFSKPNYKLDEDYLRICFISAVTSIELLLKSAISFRDWKEIFQKSLEANVSKLESGEFFSVKLEECIGRIERLNNFNIDTALKDSIEELRKQRNKLVHFHIHKNRSYFETIISKSINSYIDLYLLLIEPELLGDKLIIKDIIDLIKNKPAFYIERIIHLKPKLSSKKRPNTFHLANCFSCNHDTIIIESKNSLNCMFCLETFSIDTINNLLSFKPTIPEICPECAFKSLIIINENNTTKECYICGYYIGEPTIFTLQNDIRTPNAKRLDL